MVNRFATIALCVTLGWTAGVQGEAKPGGSDKSAKPAAEQPAPLSPTPEKKPANPAPPVPASVPEKAPNQPNPAAPVSKPQPGPADSKPSGPATTQADTQPTDFPTPAELVRRMREKTTKKEGLTQVAFFDLAQPVAEKPADFSLFGDSTLTLRSLVDRIHLARDDKSIRAVLITLGEPSMNLAQAQEIRDALSELRKVGKKTFVYADNYDTVGYTLATGATDICLLEGGEIMIPGIGMQAAFYKGALDKVGVQADYVQIGEYKGAEEPYTRTEPSPELKGELNRLVDSLYEQVVDGIATSRNLSKEVVRGMIDDTIVPARAAKDRGFIDHLLDVDQLRDLMAKELGNEVDLVYDFGKPAEAAPDFSNPFALLATLTKKPEASGKPAIALIYAEGTIVDGEGQGGLFGGDGVGSAPMRRALRSAAKDDNVKAVVIRIDSPGGSALASEVMWQAARHVAEKKPVYISIGSMAASGGYYLASAGDRIFADPSAIVGSIGVVGGKFVMKGLYDKVGLTSESFYRGKNADLFSESKPFDERQRRMVTNWMKSTYEQFTSRILHTRKDKIKDIDQVARGRIFIAKQAKDLGLVDDIGGLDAALASIAEKAQLKPGTYDIQTLPAAKTLGDLLMGNAAQASFPFKPEMKISPDSMLRVLSPQMRQSVGQQLQFLQLLQDRPVMLVSPYVLTVR